MKIALIIYASYFIVVTIFSYIGYKLFTKEEKKEKSEEIRKNILQEIE